MEWRGRESLERGLPIPGGKYEPFEYLLTALSSYEAGSYYTNSHKAKGKVLHNKASEISAERIQLEVVVQ